MKYHDFSQKKDERSKMEILLKEINEKNFGNIATKRELKDNKNIDKKVFNF